MKYIILALLLTCYMLFITDVKAEYTKDDCLNCCMGLSGNTTDCEHSCVLKFQKSQDYNSRQECNRSCRTALRECRERCFDDCTERYDPGIPGIKPLSRHEKNKRKRTAEKRSAEYLYEHRYIYDPTAPKRTRPTKKRAIVASTQQPSGSS